MKSRIYSALISTLLLAAVPAFAQDTHKNHGSDHAAQATAKTGKLVPVTEKDAAWAAKARKEYPLDVCLVSDEKLGSMGKSPEYIHRVDGQPDRLVVLCCDGCEGDFNNEPAKFLAKLDAAKTARSKGGAADMDAHKGNH